MKRQDWFEIISIDKHGIASPFISNRTNKRICATRRIEPMPEERCVLREAYEKFAKERNTGFINPKEGRAMPDSYPPFLSSRVPDRVAHSDNQKEDFLALASTRERDRYERLSNTWVRRVPPTFHILSTLSLSLSIRVCSSKKRIYILGCRILLFIFLLLFPSLLLLFSFPPPSTILLSYSADLSFLIQARAKV